MKLDCITVTKILRCFRSNRCRKWRNRFKNKKFVVLAEYFEQQQTAADVQEKLANQGEALHGGISHIYVSLWNKWKSCQGAIDSRLCTERHSKSTFNFSEIVNNYGLKQGTVWHILIISQFSLKLYTQLWKYFRMSRVVSRANGWPAWACTKMFPKDKKLTCWH